ncbi:MAG: hypothetical protein Q9170_002718 [Blastenia crenularia]
MMKSTPSLASSSKRFLHVAQPKRLHPLSANRTALRAASVLPVASQPTRVDRRWNQVQSTSTGGEIRSSGATPESYKASGLWKEITVDPSPDGLIIFLDGKPVTTPHTKVTLPIPFQKSLLATAIALEWDLLRDQLSSGKEVIRDHHIPLTAIAARAHDLAAEDAAKGPSPIRENIIKTLLPYLDTDTLLCWAPPTTNAGPSTQVTPSLRDLQTRAAQPIINYLTSSVWSGAQLRPGLENGSIVPLPQTKETKEIVQAWMNGLKAWELVGLERAVMAGKSLCVAARLVCEWGESFGDIRKSQAKAKKRFGIKEAAETTSLEVSWQTNQWGLVEDTHDVNREDLRRQFGNAILVMTG